MGKTRHRSDSRSQAAFKQRSGIQLCSNVFSVWICAEQGFQIESASKGTLSGCLVACDVQQLASKTHPAPPRGHLTMSSARITSPNSRSLLSSLRHSSPLCGSLRPLHLVVPPPSSPRLRRPCTSLQGSEPEPKPRTEAVRGRVEHPKPVERTRTSGPWSVVHYGMGEKGMFQPLLDSLRHGRSGSFRSVSPRKLKPPAPRTGSSLDEATKRIGTLGGQERL